MNYKMINGEKIYSYRWVIMALCMLAVIVVNGSTLIFAGMALPLLTPVEAGGYGLTPQEFTILNSCSYLTGFLFCLLTGTWADRQGIKKVMVIGLAISTIGAILRCFTSGFMGFFITSVIFGFGLAALNANSAKILRLWFPGNMLGFAMGIYICGATIGCAIAVPVASMFTVTTPVFIGVAVLAAINLLAWVALYKKHPDNEHPIIEPVMEHLAVCVKSKNLWIACLVIGFVMAAGAVNNGNLVAWMSIGKGIDATTAALVSSACNITCSVGGLLFPAITSKVHHEKQWLMGLGVVAIAGIAIYYFCLDGMATAVGVAVVSIIVGGYLPLSKALPAQMPDIPVQYVGAAGGLHSTVQNALAFLIPSFIVGPLITGADGTLDPTMVQYCYMGLTALVVICAAFLPKLAVGGEAPAAEESAE